MCSLFQKRPPDNALYVKTCSKNPKKTKWWYHGKDIYVLIIGGTEDYSEPHPTPPAPSVFTWEVAAEAVNLSLACPGTSHHEFARFVKTYGAG